MRHAAECFNYYFPQELDEEFLVLWHGFDQVRDLPISPPSMTFSDLLP